MRTPDLLNSVSKPHGTSLHVGRIKKEHRNCLFRSCHIATNWMAAFPYDWQQTVKKEGQYVYTNDRCFLFPPTDGLDGQASQPLDWTPHRRFAIAGFKG